MISFEFKDLVCQNSVYKVSQLVRKSFKKTLKKYDFVVFARCRRHHTRSERLSCFSLMNSTRSRIPNMFTPLDKRDSLTAPLSCLLKHLKLSTRKKSLLALLINQKELSLNQQGNVRRCFKNPEEFGPQS